MFLFLNTRSVIYFPMIYLLMPIREFELEVDQFHYCFKTTVSADDQLLFFKRGV